MGGGSQAEGIDMGKAAGEQGYLSWLKQVTKRPLKAFGLVQWAKHPVRLGTFPWQKVTEERSTVDIILKLL